VSFHQSSNIYKVTCLAYFVTCCEFVKGWKYKTMYYEYERSLGCSGLHLVKRAPGAQAFAGCSMQHKLRPWTDKEAIKYSLGWALTVYIMFN